LVTVPALPETEPVMMFENVLFPENVLLSAKSVELAAVIVWVPPAVSAVPFTVTSVPERRLVPIDVVATTVPDPFVERSAFVSPASES
jgi:hypothetical protein